MSSLPSYSPGTKAVIFDLIGTCTDWHSVILPALHAAPALPGLPPEAIDQLALDWRAGFFKELRDRFEAGQPTEDIDVTHRRVLNYLLLAKGIKPSDGWGNEVRTGLVESWHSQKGEILITSFQEFSRATSHTDARPARMAGRIRRDLQAQGEVYRVID